MKIRKDRPHHWTYIVTSCSVLLTATTTIVRINAVFIVAVIAVIATRTLIFMIARVSLNRIFIFRLFLVLLQEDRCPARRSLYSALIVGEVIIVIFRSIICII